MQIDPMAFSEFLLANGDENLVTYLKSIDTIEPIPDAFFDPLYEKLKMYYVTGGMPESVKMWTEARDVEAMQEALSGIIGAYERDFAKHPDVHEFPKISMIWKSVPSQLARENNDENKNGDRRYPRGMNHGNESPESIAAQRIRAIFSVSIRLVRGIVIRAFALLKCHWYGI